MKPFNWTYFFIFFYQHLVLSHWIEWAINQPINQSTNQSIYRNIIINNNKHIQIADLSSATINCTAFLIVFEYILFSTCQANY